MVFSKKEMRAILRYFNVRNRVRQPAKGKKHLIDNLRGVRTTTEGA